MNKVFNIRNLLTLVFFASAVTAALPYDSVIQKKSRGKVLHTVERRHKFSSGKTRDLFRLRLSGKDTLNGVINFQIITPDRHIIYKEEFPSVYLVGYEVPTHRDSCRQVIERMNKFFAEKNFITPAINKKDTFDPESSDRKIWEDISSDTTAVGFSYVIFAGEPSNRQIAYSRRTAKVVLYRNYN